MKKRVWGKEREGIVIGDNFLYSLDFEYHWSKSIRTANYTNPRFLVIPFEVAMVFQHRSPRHDCAPCEPAYALRLIVAFKQECLTYLVHRAGMRCF